MTKVIIKILTSIFVLFVVSYLIPGFKFSSIEALVVSAVVIGITNAFIRPILQIVALPISIMTFGLFAFFINVSLLYLVSKLVDGFTINRFTTAIIASITMSLVTWFINHLAKE